MTVIWEKSREDYYATNLAEYYLTLYSHKLQTAAQRAVDEPEESESVGAFAESMRRAGLTETTIKPS